MSQDTSNRIDLGLFAGPGGWSQACASLGLREVGIELDRAACATRAAAGHATIRADVASLPVAHLAGKIRGLIGSPPCQGYSNAGKREGLADIDLCHDVLHDLAHGRDSRAAAGRACADPRSLLVVEPLRYALAARPAWIALEQVPAVLPLWQHTASLLRDLGFSTWTGILNAADYGVPQTRRRAILLASRHLTVAPPSATHAETAEPSALFGEGRRRWVAMADALGWGMTGRPYFTLATAGGNRGGADEQVGGSASRKALYAERSRGAWLGRADPSQKIRLSLAEASILQTFPADYPWAGSRSKAFQQIGNAVPPLLARAILGTLTVSHSRLAVAA